MKCPYCHNEIMTGNTPFIGQEIVDLLDIQGKKVTDLARACEVSYQQVHNWKTNRHRPGPRKIPAIAEFFQINKTELLNGTWRTRYESAEA